MMDLIAQASQPALQEWVYDNIPWDRVMWLMAKVSAVVTALIFAFWKLVNIGKEQWWGSKRLSLQKQAEFEQLLREIEAKQQKQHENLKTLAQFASPNVQNTVSMNAKLDAIANE